MAVGPLSPMAEQPSPSKAASVTSEAAPSLTASSSSGSASTAFTLLSSSSSSPALRTIASLPNDILSRVFSHLESPLDLYRASLVSRTFRTTATDSNLWEKHYWNFYRAPSTFSLDEQDQLLLARRTTNRHNAMRAWADVALATGPRKSLGPLIVKTSGGQRWYEPLFAGSLLLTEMNVLKPGRLRELANRFGAGGPVDPQEAPEQIISQLIKESGKTPSAEQRAEAEVKRAQRREMEKMSRDTTPPSYPAFLLLDEDEAARAPPPLDFHFLFTKRIKEDDRLLLALRKLVSLDCGLVDHLLHLAEDFGDGARDILAALCADQHLTEDTISHFAHFAGARSSDKIKDWPRAIEVHERAAKGKPQLRLGHCLALHSIAEQLLTHLQRREAITLVQQLHARFKSPPPRSQPLKERVLECSQGVEEALISMSLFRYADSGEVSEYLDLLALHIWADIQARTRYDKNFVEVLNRSRNDGTSSAENQETPADSTRLLMKRITLSLRHLGFSVAYTVGKEEGAFDDFFLNTSLYCPAQRSTSPLILTAILCSVARRLGVSATLVSAKKHAMALILENGPEPPGWSTAPRTIGSWTGQGKDWSRFYYTAAYEGQWVSYEAGQYASYCAAAAGTGKQKPNTEPATPVEVVLRLAEDMRGNVHSKLPVGFKLGLGGGWEDDAAVMSRACTRELRDFLLGNRSMPPSPFLPPIKPSSLTHLPPTRANAPRAKLPNLKPLATYTAWLTIRILEPTRSKADEDVLLTTHTQNSSPIIPLHPTLPSTPSQRINSILSSCIASDPTIRCDVVLLLQVNGADVKREMEVARSVGASKGKPNRVWDGGSKRAPIEVRKWVAAILEEDAKPASGGGGGLEVYGVGGGAKGMGDRVRRKELLDPSHPRNVEVVLRVGAVVRHRVRGWKGVVVGWDAVCQMDGMELLVEGLDSPSSRGIFQPFYHVLTPTPSTSTTNSTAPTTPTTIRYSAKTTSTPSAFPLALPFPKQLPSSASISPSLRTDK